MTKKVRITEFGTFGREMIQNFYVKLYEKSLKELA